MPACFKDDSESQFDPRTGDYVGDLYRYAKFHHDPITPFRPPNVRKFASSDSASVLGAAFWAYSQEPGTDVTINTSNDVVSRKDVPFGGLENKILYFDPIFPKTEIVGQFLTGLRNFRLKKAITLGDAHL